MRSQPTALTRLCGHPPSGQGGQLGDTVSMLTRMLSRSRSFFRRSMSRGIPPLERPWRKDREHHRRRHGVGEHVRRHRDSFGARRLFHLEKAGELRPVAPPHRFRVGVVYAGAGIEADAENLGDGVEEGLARAPHVTREDASGTSDPPRQERKLLRRGVHARRIDEPRRKPESSLLERGLESLGHEAPCLTARLAGSERMDAETKRAVRNQRSHVHRKTDALQVRKVVADSLPAPGEGSRRHPAVDLGKDLGGAAEERRRAKAAVSHDLRRDALGDPSFEERKPIVRGPRENEVAVGMEVDETRCDDLSRRVDDVLGFDLFSEARDLPAPDREISPELGCAGTVENASVLDDEVGSHDAASFTGGLSRRAPARARPGREGYRRRWERPRPPSPPASRRRPGRRRCTCGPARSRSRSR